MKSAPIQDCFARDGSMRLDGQMTHDIGSLRAQALSVSKGLPWAAERSPWRLGAEGRRPRDQIARLGERS